MPFQAGLLKRHIKKCDREVVHILDEFGNIIPLSNISNKMSAGAGKGLLYTLILQSFAQLEPYKENAKTIRDNCSNQVYILSADSDTREQFSKAVGNETVTNVHRNGHYLSLDKTFMEVYEERPLITANKLANLAEGENVIVRYTKRRDMNREKIRAYPIFNTGSTAFKYRYEYLEDIFKSDVLFKDLPIINQCQSNYNLLNITINTENLFAEKMKRKTAIDEGRVYYDPFETSDTLRLIRNLKQSQIIKNQLKLYVDESENIDDMRVGEAIVIFQKAQKVGKLTNAECSSLIDLMIVNEKGKIR